MAETADTMDSQLTWLNTTTPRLQNPSVDVNVRAQSITPRIPKPKPCKLTLAGLWSLAINDAIDG